MEQVKKLNKLLTRENKVCRMVVSQFVSESVNSHTYPGHKRSELLTRQLVNMLRENTRKIPEQSLPTATGKLF